MKISIRFRDFVFAIFGLTAIFLVQSASAQNGELNADKNGGSVAAFEQQIPVYWYKEKKNKGIDIVGKLKTGFEWLFLPRKFHKFWPLYAYTSSDIIPICNKASSGGYMLGRSGIVYQAPKNSNSEKWNIGFPISGDNVSDYPIIDSYKETYAKALTLWVQPYVDIILENNVEEKKSQLISNHDVWVKSYKKALGKGVAEIDPGKWVEIYSDELGDKAPDEWTKSYYTALTDATMNWVSEVRSSTDNVKLDMKDWKEAWSTDMVTMREMCWYIKNKSTAEYLSATDGAGDWLVATEKPIPGLDIATRLSVESMSSSM